MPYNMKTNGAESNLLRTISSNQKSYLVIHYLLNTLLGDLPYRIIIHYLLR